MKGDIIIEAGSGGIDVGVLRTGSPSTSGLERPGEIRLQTIKEDEGVPEDGEYDITTEHLRVEGKGYGSVYINSDGSLTIDGSQSAGGAVHVKTNAVADDEDALSFICLTAEKDVTINTTGDKGILAEAHGNRESVASIWIGAGTNVRDPEEGYSGTVTIYGNLEADARSPGSGFVKTDATIRVYGSAINLNGDKDPKASAGSSIKYQNNVSGYVDSDVAVYEAVDPDPPNPDPLHDELISGSRALVDIDITKDGTCLNCGNVQRKILPIAILDSLRDSKNIMVYAVVVLANDKESGSAPQGSLVDGTVLLADNSTTKGTLTLINGDTEVQYEPPTDWVFDENGEFIDYFEYYAVDSDGDISEDPALVTIILINQDPVAQPDDYDGGHNVALEVTGDPLADVITGVAPVENGDYDPDNAIEGRVFDDVLTAELGTDATYGTVVLNGDGTFTYTPTAGNTTGSDSFTYYVTDGYGGQSETVTVEIILSNTAPVAQPDSYATSQNVELEVTGDPLADVITGVVPLENGDTDQDNEIEGRLFDDILTSFLAGGGSTGPTDEGGFVALDTDGTFTYTPPTGFSGPDSFTYFVTDSYDNSNTVQVTITVLDTPPPPPPPPPPPTPPLLPVAPLPVLEQPIIEGCPVLMDAVASELGITSETVQISIGVALALNPGIQPCDACASLVDAIAILRDPAGIHMAAMMQVFDTLAPAGTPFTPEMAASIATAFADNLDNPDIPQYASAMEYADAFVEYIAVLDTELGSPVDDSMALVMEKYGAPLTESDNPNIGAYIAARLAAAGM
jgi:hypothetical protein